MRTQQLLKGANPLVKSDNRDVILALREIAAGKVRKSRKEARLTRNLDKGLRAKWNGRSTGRSKALVFSLCASQPAVSSFILGSIEESVFFLRFFLAPYAQSGKWENLESS